MSWYRAVLIRRSEGMYRVQVRHWWWPFWSTFQYAADIERAHSYAWRHANPYPKTIVQLGSMKVARKRGASA